MATVPFMIQNMTYRHLMEAGNTYRVPPFQRNYAWGEDEWDDLWQDIVGLPLDDAEQSHFMGFLVLHAQESRHFSIIDGQQRLTTLSILILSAISLLRDMASNGENTELNTQRGKLFFDSYIGNINSKTMAVSAKLTLNQYNNIYYKNYLAALDDLPSMGRNESEILMRQAFFWFKGQLQAFCAKDTDRGAHIADLVDTVADKLFFSAVTVSSDSNAFVLFETLNARGVRLSATDLLKNYLYSCIDDDHMESPVALRDLETTWLHITSCLGEDSFADFLRIFWNSCNRIVRKNALFKTLSREIREPRKAFVLLKNLDRAAPVYAALRSPYDIGWNSREEAALEALQIFDNAAPLSLLLTCHKVFFSSSRQTFTRIVEAAAGIAFRSSIVGNMAFNEQERVYNDVALKILAQEYTSEKQIINALKPLYPDDELFRLSFSKKSIPTMTSKSKKLVRYILFKLEKHRSNISFEPFNEQYTIEHIFPVNPSEGWTVAEFRQMQRMVFRLGNMTLLEAASNRAVGNSSYKQKREVYKTSVFQTTRVIAEYYGEWCADTIGKRQKHMADIAVQIWKVRF